MVGFNDYDDDGYRTTQFGTRSHKTEDEAIVSNLRFRWGQRLAHISNTHLVNLYDEFALSDMFGNNDERFPEWLESVGETETSNQ